MSYTEDAKIAQLGFGEPVNSGNDVGIIYGNVGTAEFDCNVYGQIEKNDYIQVWHDSHGWVLGQVDTLVRKTDLSIAKARAISKGEDVDFEDRVSAKVNIIGYRDKKGLLQVPRAPFKAGQPLYVAEEKLIRDVLGLHKQEGAFVGKLNGHDIDIYLDINSMVQKHISILAKTGGGKSYIAGVFIEELMKHDVTVMILDPHGEYHSLATKGSQGDKRFDVKPKDYKDKIVEFSPDIKINTRAKALRFTLANMTPKDLLSFTNIKNPRSFTPALKSAMEMLRSAKPDFTIGNIITVLEGEENPKLDPLISELHYLQDLNIFASKGTSIDELVQKGKCSVINFRGTPPDIQELMVMRISQALFECRKINRIPPMMLVVEEAHNYCPQAGTVASSKIFKTIASEGRKFGLGLAIITQRPAKVDKNVLSQCNTQVILKVTNPNDLGAVTKSVEGLTSGTADEIQRLPIGVAIITSPKLSTPLFVEIRPRETKHGGESVKII